MPLDSRVKKLEEDMEKMWGLLQVMAREISEINETLKRIDDDRKPGELPQGL